MSLDIVVFLPSFETPGDLCVCLAVMALQTWTFKFGSSNVYYNHALKNFHIVFGYPLSWPFHDTVCLNESFFMFANVTSCFISVLARMTRQNFTSYKNMCN